MQNHKPSRDHLMYGVKPNWEEKTKDGGVRIKQTREKMIIDYIIQNIHKNTEDIGVEQEEEQANDGYNDSEKKQKYKNKYMKFFFARSNSCIERLFISVKNPIYQVWKIWVILCCIGSSYVYGYIAAFEMPDKENSRVLYYLDLGFDIIFYFDVVVQFLLEYKPEDQFNFVRDLTEIAKRYLRTRFFLDLIALIPFVKFFDGPQRKLCYFIKVIRIKKAGYLLSSNTFMRQVKVIFQQRLQKLIDEDPELAENCDLDNNNIMLILMISYFFKTFKLIVIIITVSYFKGMIWYIYCDLTFIPED